MFIYDYNGQGTIKLPCPYTTNSLLTYYMYSDFEGTSTHFMRYLIWRNLETATTQKSSITDFS